MSSYTIRGIKIEIAPDIIPKMQLGEAVREFLTEDFIIETNRWMAEFFGCTSMLKDGEIYHNVPDGVLYMNSRTWKQVRSALILKGEIPK